MAWLSLVFVGSCHRNMLMLPVVNNLIICFVFAICPKILKNAIST